MRLWNLVQQQMNLSTMAPWGQEEVAIVERWPLPSREVRTRVNVWTVRKQGRCGAGAVSEGSTYLCLKNADSFQLLTGTTVAIVKQGALATTTATATRTSKKQ